MLFIHMLQWWYGSGWVWITQQFFVRRVGRVASFFSVGDLAKTLFAPFRQDNLNTKGAPIGLKLQAFGGNIISRVLGFFIRLVLIILGLLSIIIVVILGVCMAIIWPLIPLGPIIAVVLWIVGLSG